MAVKIPFVGKGEYFEWPGDFLLDHDLLDRIRHLRAIVRDNKLVEVCAELSEECLFIESSWVSKKDGYDQIAFERWDTRDSRIIVRLDSIYICTALPIEGGERIRTDAITHNELEEAVHLESRGLGTTAACVVKLRA